MPSHSSVARAYTKRSSTILARLRGILKQLARDAKGEDSADPLAAEPLLPAR